MIAVEFDRERSASAKIVVNVPARGFDVGKSVKPPIRNKMCQVFWRDARTLLIDTWPHEIASVISENGTISVRRNALCSGT